jgi:hypothetical protein
MMDPKQQRRFQGDSDAKKNAIDASADFDLWAREVRKQMLSCLRKRSSQSLDS